MPDLSDK